MTEPWPVRIIGVGYGGVDVVDRLAKEGCATALLIGIDATGEILDRVNIARKLRIDSTAFRRVLCSIPADLAREAALASAPRILDLVAGARAVIIVAFLDEGAALGIAPVVASFSRGAGAKTIGIITLPLSLSGKRLRSRCEQGMEAMRINVDELVPIHFDDVLRDAPESIQELLERCRVHVLRVLTEVTALVSEGHGPWQERR